MKRHAQGGSTGRLFFRSRGSTRARRGAAASLLVLAAAVAPAAAARADASAPGSPALVAIGARDAARVIVLDCRGGRELAAAALPAPLAAEVALAPDGTALYAATRDRELLRYTLPELRVQARATLGFEATELAAAGGSDAVVLAGGRGADALSAREPATLAELQRYRLPEPFAVSAIRDVAARARFVVAFTDLEEAWEIAYDRDAPPVLQGLVHDYRMGEAVPLPGRFTPRRFALAGATQALVAGPAPYEAARVDRSGALGIVHLDVRREIERPATGAAPHTARIVAWRGGARRGWLVAAPGASEAEVLEAGAWRVTGRVAVAGEILALAEAGERVLVAHASKDRVRVSLLDVARRAIETQATVVTGARPPLRFVRGTGGCVALLDRDGRWLAGFAAPALR